MLKKASFLFLTLFASCNKPYYHPPVVETPTKWRMSESEGEARANLDWWQEFNDPVLTKLILHALQNSQELKLAIARVLEYQARLGIAQSDFYPQVNLDLRAHRLARSALLPGGVPVTVPRHFNDFLGAFRLAWELDFWGRIQSASQAAFDDLLSSISARQAIAVTVVRTTASAYFALRGLDAQLLLAQETVKSRLKTLELATIRFNLGETSELEAKQEAAQVEVAVIRSLELEKAIALQENLLSLLIGDPPHTIERGLPLQEMSVTREIPSGLPSDLLYRRPDIMGAEEQIMAAQARITQARALFFPQVSLTGLYGYESVQLSELLTGKSLCWDLGVNMLQMVFDGWKVSSTVKLAKAQACQAIATYRQTILQAFREVEDALVGIKKNRELVAEHNKQIKILEETLHLANLRYAEGEVDYLNVLNTQRDLFDAQLAGVEALSLELRGIVDLYSALGGGWVIEADTIGLGLEPDQCDTALLTLNDIPESPYAEEVCEE